MPDSKPTGYLCLDIETAGRKPDDPIQIAAIIKESGTSETATLDVAMQPTGPMLPAAIAVHGVSDAKVATFIKTVEGLQAASLWLKQYENTHVFVGYNHVAFDLPILHESFARAGVPVLHLKHEPLDVMLLAQKVVPAEESGNYKLDTIYVTLFPDKVEHLKKVRAAHDALDDVQLTFEILSGLVARMRAAGDAVTPKALYAKINDPVEIERWPFGEHKGEYVTDVVSRFGFNGRNIITWFLGKTDMHESYADLLYTLKILMR